ncbi:uncharacterized protein LOC130020345 [Sorex fumeus]|uniref:uncharacterized protein LOC130020345 n=1 Tax=Sorex fumeus TaxID=62283 RepID=UPI0024AE51AB|nr:uncharacterized protein LOC130020345 [Sorex fumeus]
MGNCFFGIKDHRPLPVLLVLRVFLPGAPGKSCRVAVLGSGGCSRMALVKKWIRDNFHGSRLPSLEAIYRLVDAFARNPERASGQGGIRCFLGGHRFSFPLSRSPVIILVYAPNKKPTMEDMKSICDLIREIQSHNLCHRYAVLLLQGPATATAATATATATAAADREGAHGPRAAGEESARARERPQNLGQRPGAEGRAAAESPEKAHCPRDPKGDGHDDGKAGPRGRPE